ncbi:HAD family hydrolase [Kribbella sp. NPDC056345]|uniref:HAD family hydrolase n=1 Tax=Kribbella sp. NPDC056345 TaxID=3345789 RepID=UPI0035E2C5E8
MKLFARLATAGAAAGLLFALPTTATAAPPAAQQLTQHSTRCSVVWFDLGNTLVDTKAAGQMTWMAGAQRHLRQLRSVGVPVGLITNVPPEWGATDAERAAATKAYVDGQWAEADPFPWALFGDRILTPRTKAESKPALALFERGKSVASPCRSFYEGETPAEITAAEQAGLTGYLTGQPDQPAFIPLWRVLFPVKV